MSLQNLVSFAGIFLLVGLAWLFSKDRKSVSIRTILGGLALQCAVAIFIFIVPAGTQVFLFVNDVVVKVLGSAAAGTRFVFGPLAIGPGQTGSGGETSIGFILAFQALPTIVFFAALMGALYYLGVMPFMIRIFSRIFSKLMHVSGAESMCAASNIFVGVESTIVIRPYLGEMTRSELCTVLAAGMGTIASSMLAFYVMVLQKQFPTIAGHLVSASILAAPGAVVISKILYPEKESPKTMGVNITPFYEREHNVIEAMMNGATSGTRLVVGVGGMLLAFLGMVALLDLILTAIGSPVNTLLGAQGVWSLKSILSYIFYPLTILIGVPLADAGTIAGIIGERTLLTEVVSYQDLAGVIAAGTLKDPRSAVLAVYALCGFAHVASLAIFVGGAAAIAPGRTKDLSEIGFRALCAATLSSLLTACWAGTFYTGNAILLSH